MVENKKENSQLNEIKTPFTETQCIDLTVLLKELCELNFQDTSLHIETLSIIAMRYANNNPNCIDEKFIEAIFYFNNLARITQTYNKPISEGINVFESLLIDFER